MTKTILSNTAISGIGILSPLLVGLFFMPIILNYFGNDILSILIIFWSGMTFFTNFDFGIGRSVVKLLKTSQQTYKYGKTKIMSVGLLMQFMAAVVLAIVCSILLFLVNQISVMEYSALLYLFFLSMPVFALTSLLRLMLEAESCYVLSTFISTVNGIGLFLVPYFLIGFGGVEDIIHITLLVRGGGLLVVLSSFLYKHKGILVDIKNVDINIVKMIFTSGKWLTLGAALSPIITFADRFISAYTVSASNLIYYLVPLEFIQKISIIPVMLCRVLFPVIVENDSGRDIKNFKIFNDAIMTVFSYVIFILVLSFFVKSLLEIWLGEEFSDSAGMLPVILLIGTAFSGFTYLAATGLIARGDYRIHPKIMMMYLPIYILILVGSSQLFGALGLALTYSLRIVSEAFFLVFAYERRRFHNEKKVLSFKGIYIVALVLSFFSVGANLWLQ